MIMMKLFGRGKGGVQASDLKTNRHWRPRTTQDTYVLLEMSLKSLTAKDILQDDCL